MVKSTVWVPVESRVRLTVNTRSPPSVALALSMLKVGISSSMIERTQAKTADFVNGIGELIPPLTCAADPVKSAFRPPPSISIVTLMGIGPGSIPSSSI